MTKQCDEQSARKRFNARFYIPKSSRGNPDINQQIKQSILVCLFFFFFFWATPLSMWDLSSLNRDQTLAPYIGNVES